MQGCEDGKPRSISVVSAGPGAEHSLMGCLNFTWYDLKRKRRGWTPQGIPTLEAVKRLRKNFPEVVELLKAHGVE